MLKDKKQIEDWLNKYHIKKYELIPDNEYGYIVNVNQDVLIWYRNLKSIDIKFNKVDGFFVCSHNMLTTVQNFPNEVRNGIDCSFNKIESLQDLLIKKECNFICSNNELDIKGLKSLNLKNKIKFLNLEENKKLNEIQNIKDFNQIKEILKTMNEKENLLNRIKKEDLNKNKIINKI